MVAAEIKAGPVLVQIRSIPAWEAASSPNGGHYCPLMGSLPHQQQSNFDSHIAWLISQSYKLEAGSMIAC